MKSTVVYILFIVFAMSSCRQRFKSPEMVIPDSYAYAIDRDTLMVLVDEQWWEIFGDTTLNNLIELALTNNQDVLIAYSKILEAGYQYKVNRSAYLPSVNMSMSGNGEYNTREKIIQEYEFQPNMSWEVSLFGALKNSNRAGRAEILASKYSYRGVMLVLASEVAQNYFSLIRYRESLRISRDTYAIRNESLILNDSLLKYGMSTSLTHEQARGQVARALVSVANFEQMVAQTETTLSILLGVPPTKIKTITDFVSYQDVLPDYVPVGLPLQLLERRPDLLRSYAEMEAAFAKVGIAKAVRYPLISLTASGGLLSDAVKKLFDTDAGVWEAMLSITQPIFQAGKLKNSQRVAEQQLYQAEQNYKKIFISALKDVDDALIQVASLVKQCNDYELLVRSSERVDSITLQLYDLGMSNYFDVVSTSTDVFNSKLQYISLLSQKYSSYVNLYKALGGGW